MENFTVYKHPAPYKGLNWAFNVPTFGGFRGQVLSYHLKSEAADLADKWQAAYDKWEKEEHIKKLFEPKTCKFEDIGDEPPVNYGGAL